MENKQEDLLEWYYSGAKDLDVVISKLGRDRRAGDSPCGQRIRKSELDEPSTADMSQTPPESPQNDIQREIERQGKENEQPTTADQVAFEDKKKMYRAFGMVEVLEGRIKELYQMTNSYQNEPERREQLSSDLKQITRELADLVSEL